MFSVFLALLIIFTIAVGMFKLIEVPHIKYFAPIIKSKAKIVKIVISVDVTDYIKRNKFNQKEAAQKIKQNLVESNIISNYGDLNTVRVSIN